MAMIIRVSIKIGTPACKIHQLLNHIHTHISIKQHLDVKHLLQNHQ